MQKSRLISNFADLITGFAYLASHLLIFENKLPLIDTIFIHKHKTPQLIKGRGIEGGKLFIIILFACLTIGDSRPSWSLLGMIGR
jgi:hypothetical protein